MNYLKSDIHIGWLRGLVLALLLLGQYQKAGSQVTPLPEGQHTMDLRFGQVWYDVVGDGTGIPVVMLHGGPGGTSHALYFLAPLGKERQLIILDQPGTGRSGYMTDTTKMKIDTMVHMLHEFISKLGLNEYYLYGHSWGTMLGIDYYLTYPEGIKAMILNSPLASTKMWIADADTLVASLPDSIQDAIAVNERNQTYHSKAYRQAIWVYSENFISRHPRPEFKEAPPPVRGNNLMYNYMWGPSEFHATGNLKHYDRLGDLGKINVPVLFITGEYDEARPATVKYYHSLVPGSQFSVIPDAAHGTMYDNREMNIEVIRTFINSLENEH